MAKKMNKLMIEDAHVEVEGGGLGCDVAVGEVRLRLPDGESAYMTLLEVDSIPTFLRSEESILKPLLEEEDPDVVSGLCKQYSIYSGEYDELFENPDELWMPVFRYLIYLVRCDWEQVQPFLDATVGHAVNEVEIPMSDVEEEWQEEQ